MKAGAAPADEFQIKVTRCHDEKFGFALFRHERRAGSGLLLPVKFVAEDKR
jgi:hypothetical protein